ncbi:MAG: RNA-binding S4 domain-containing protein [Flavobacteriales bacterium]|nr:RNA-binding S4 domain-containing protein [Flavobacteriales bacterium]
MRIDKFLWCVRLFASRTLAASECGKGHVWIGERVVKPSAEVEVGDRFSVRVPPIRRTFEVRSLPKSRVGAKLVPEHVMEHTSPEELEKLQLARMVRSESRDPGEGRPTKRDRRDIDRYTGW